MEDKELDSLFREKLANHRVLPREEVWQRLDAKLNSEPKRVVWLPYAASMALLIAAVFGMKGLLERDHGINHPLVTQLTEAPFDVPVIVPIAEQNQHPIEPLRPSRTAKTVSKELPKPLPKPSDSQLAENARRDITGIDTVELLDPVIATDFIAEANADQDEELRLLMDSHSEEMADNSEVTIRIVSNGYAFASEKPALIEGIEGGIGKLGGIIAKVDKGFAELQDVKNNFFASGISLTKDRKESQDR